MIMEEDIRAISENFLEIARSGGLRAATAESCTGGMISAALTAIPGSSDVVDCGFVTYSNEAKQRMLGVAARTLEAYGAVSAETAMEMADGCRRKSGVDLAIAVTGIAGPGGGGPLKPVGLVYLGVARCDWRNARAEKREYGETASRSHIRLATTRDAIQMLIEAARDLEKR